MDKLYVVAVKVDEDDNLATEVMSLEKAHSIDWTNMIFIAGLYRKVDEIGVYHKNRQGLPLEDAQWMESHFWKMIPEDERIRHTNRIAELIEFIRDNNGGLCFRSAASLVLTTRSDNPERHLVASRDDEGNFLLRPSDA